MESCPQHEPTPRTAAIEALNNFTIDSGSIDAAHGTFEFTQRYQDGPDTYWKGCLMRLNNVEDQSDDPVSVDLEQVASRAVNLAVIRFVLARDNF